jgi:hypothetical protein
MACVWVLAAAPASAQLDFNTITVTATRGSTPPADQALFRIDVTSGVDKGLEDVIAALPRSGITADSFTGIGFPFLQPPTLSATIDWQFSVAVPIGQIRQEALTLARLQQDLTTSKSGLTLSFNLAAFQGSPQLQQMQACSQSALMGAAKAQAQKFAAAAGLALGAAISISSAGPECAMTVKFAATRSL